MLSYRTYTHNLPEIVIYFVYWSLSIYLGQSLASIQICIKPSLTSCRIPCRWKCSITGMLYFSNFFNLLLKPSASSSGLPNTFPRCRTRVRRKSSSHLKDTPHYLINHLRFVRIFMLLITICQKTYLVLKSFQLNNMPWKPVQQEITSVSLTHLLCDMILNNR